MVRLSVIGGGCGGGFECECWRWLVSFECWRLVSCECGMLVSFECGWLGRFECVWLVSFDW